MDKKKIEFNKEKLELYKELIETLALVDQRPKLLELSETSSVHYSNISGWPIYDMVTDFHSDHMS